MSTITYKRLFEVRILHDYYLMKAFKESSSISFFTASNQNQGDILTKVMKLNQFSATDYFDIQPLSETEKLLEQYQIRLIKNTLGFFLGIEVNSTRTSTNTGGFNITYQPKTTIPNKLHLQFTIKSKDSQLYNKAQLPAPSLLNTKFYFSNFNAAGNKTFPVLAEGTNGLVDSVDLKFLPFKIKVNTTPGKQIKAQLISNDGSGTILIEKEQLATTDTLQLNFQQRNTYIPDSPLFPDGLYQILVEEDGSTVRQGTFFLSDKYYRESNFGVFDFYFDAQSPNFNFLENQTDLKTKLNINNNGVRTPTKHPVYELRLNGDFS